MQSPIQAVNAQRIGYGIALDWAETPKMGEEEFAAYLQGSWREEHLFNLESALQMYDAVQERIAAQEARLLAELEALEPQERRGQEVSRHPNAGKEKAMRGRGEQRARRGLWRFAGVDLTRIDGISAGAAQTVLTEVGLDLSAFPTEGHFVSWLRLTPRTAISGGKPLRGKKRGGTGANRVAAVLRMAAVALQRSHSALGAAFRRKARHKGYSVAVFATARKLATLVYRMLRWGQDYLDSGEKEYEARFRRQRLAGLEAAAKSLGYGLVKRPEQHPGTDTRDGPRNPAPSRPCRVQG